MANAVSEIYGNYQQAASKLTDPRKSATELAQTEQQSVGGAYIARGYAEIGWFGIGVMLYDYVSCVNSSK